MTSNPTPDVSTIVERQPEMIYPGFRFDRGLPDRGPGSRPRFTKRRGLVDWDAPGTPEILKIVTNQAVVTILARIYHRQDRTITIKLRPATVAAIPTPERTALMLFAASLARTSALSHPCLDTVQIRTLVLTSAAQALEDWADVPKLGPVYLGKGPDLAMMFH